MIGTDALEVLDAHVRGLVTRSSLPGVNSTRDSLLCQLPQSLHHVASDQQERDTNVVVSKCLLSGGPAA